MTENESIRRAAMLSNAGPDARAGGEAAGGTSAFRGALQRDQRRLAWLAGMAIALWVVVIGVVTTLITLFFLAVRPKLLHMAQDSGERLGAMISYVLALGTTLLAVAVGILAVAVLATLATVFATRRSTLRQVSAQLAEVSRELRELRISHRPADSQ